MRTIRNFTPALLLAHLATSACSSDDNKDTGGNNNPDAAVAPDTNGGVDAIGGGPDANGDPDANTGNEDGGLEPGVAPIRRGDMAYAGDIANGKVYFFHGDTAEPVQCQPAASAFIEDGWVYDIESERWAEVVAAEGSPKPIQRARANGAWDAMRNRFIMFGGRYRAGASGAYTFFKDIWAFDPATATWTELASQ